MFDMDNDINIYILAHKPVKYTCDISKYKILQCGAEINEKFGDILDNSGDNISIKNKYWVETTGIYWIWKSCKFDIKGHTQYRRFLSVNPDFVANILEDYDIILASPISFRTPLERIYAGTHNINDLHDCEKIIKKQFREYSNAYDFVIKQNDKLYFSNSFIAKREIYDGLCEFCFGVLEEFEKMHKFTCYEDVYEYESKYFNNFSISKQTLKDFKDGHPEIDDMAKIQSMVFGYLFERLLNVYIWKNNLKIYECGNYITNMLKNK